MTVVSDTTAITNLFLIGRIDILQGVFGHLIVPNAVFQELCEVSEQQDFLLATDWIKIFPVEESEVLQALKLRLDAGESEAIALAIQISADYLVMDEWKGRRTAKRMGLQIIGVLGILEVAKRKCIIPAIKPVLDELINRVGFRIHPSIYQMALTDADEM